MQYQRFSVIHTRSANEGDKNPKECKGGCKVTVTFLFLFIITLSIKESISNFLSPKSKSSNDLTKVFKKSPIPSVLQFWSFMAFILSLSPITFPVKPSPFPNTPQPLNSNSLRPVALNHFLEATLITSFSPFRAILSYSQSHSFYLPIQEALNGYDLQSLIPMSQSHTALMTVFQSL
jgi:hypothetical protein